MTRLLKFFMDEEKRTILFLVLSAFALILSFFEGEHFFVDPAWLAIILCGLPIIKEAVIGLVTEFDIKADVLVSIALIAAVIIGETFAAGEVAFIMVIGALLEERTVAKARAGIEKLVHLVPQTARVVRRGQEEVIPAEEVKVGDTLRVLAGETIPVDGSIILGQSSINQAVLTGESLPVDKAEGDQVFSGTVNQFGTFEMRADKAVEDSSVQRMVQLVKSADAGKAKIVGLADRWATWIVVIALLSAVGTWLVTGEAIRAVTILVVFCPCALVLATPTAIMAGIGNASKFGALVREGDALERLSQVKILALDKTGTITSGKAIVKNVVSLNPDFDRHELLKICASAELRSEHPLGKAISSYYTEQNGIRPDEPEHFELLPGKGIKARVNGIEVEAGNAGMFEKNLNDSDAINQAAEFEKTACTIVYISLDGSIAGFIALSDTLRPEAPAAISAIEAQGVKVLLLTGDNKASAENMASQAGISDFKYDCLPETKLAIIEELQNSGTPVGMVGDGLNDAPALKKARTGIAMGGIGSDITIDAADIVLVSDEIKVLPHLIFLARKTMRTIKVNMSASMILNFVAILLAMSGLLSPVLGALVHNLGSVLVIINSALLLNTGLNKKNNEAKLIQNKQNTAEAA